MSHRPAPALLILLAAAAALFPGAGFPAAPEAPDPFSLRRGVVADPGRGLLYLMRPGGGIDAVDLASGRTLWTARKKGAAVPLALVGDLLVAQAESVHPTNELEMVVLDVAKGGRVTVTGKAALPPGVRAVVDETLEDLFLVEGRGLGDGNVFVSWSHRKTLPGGRMELKSGTAAEEGSEAASDSAVIHAVGRFILDPKTGRIFHVPSHFIAPAVPPDYPEVPAGERIAGVAGRQFISADGRDVLVSERVNDRRVTEPYRWTIYSRSPERRLGEMRNMVSWTPFFVSGRRLVYESLPYFETRGGKVRESPRQLEAVDLGTGAVPWSRAIRETAYRGPFPP